MTYRAAAPPGAGSWVAFANEGDYHAWHDQACLDAGIPFPGYNADGTPALEDQWTTALALPIRIDGELCIWATTEQIAADSTLKQLPVIVPKYPAEPGSPVDPTGAPISEVEVEPPLEVDPVKPLPPTWTDPNTGDTYPVPSLEG